MKLDNAKRAGYIKLIYMLIPLILVMGAASVYLFFEVKDLRYMAFAFVVLLLFFAIMSVFKYNYIVFYAGPDKIQIRFKGLSPLNAVNNTVKIQAENFRNYEIRTKLGGLRKSLILYLETPSGYAKYPDIAITSLKTDEIEQIQKAFDLILAINKSKTE